MKDWGRYALRLNKNRKTLKLLDETLQLATLAIAAGEITLTSALADLAAMRGVSARDMRLLQQDLTERCRYLAADRRPN